jgi:hypothetical protein
MDIQTMGLDYGWLVDLAKLIAAARQQPATQGAPTGAVSVSPYAGPTSSFPSSGVAGESAEEVAYYNRQRAEKEAGAQREHEITMQGLVNQPALAQAISQERGGVEVAKIGAAGQVAAAQKTTADKAKETIDLLLQMTPEGQAEFVNSLKAKRAESQGSTPSGGTITSGGRTVTTPGAAKATNPNDPLSWIEETYGADAETVIANLQPKTVAAGAQKTAANLLDDFQKLVIKGDLNTMLTLLTGGQGVTQVTDALQQFGESNGYPQEVIDDVKATITGLAPATTTTGGEGNENKTEKKGLIAGTIQKAMHPEELGQTPAETQEYSKLWQSGAGPEKPTEMGQSIKDFFTTAFAPILGMLPKKGEPVLAEPTKKSVGKQVGPTVEDAIAAMKTWDTNKIKAFQKKVGVNPDGKMSLALVNAMKAYYEKHKEEWGVVK